MTWNALNYIPIEKRPNLAHLQSSVHIPWLPVFYYLQGLNQNEVYIAENLLFLV